MVAGARMKCMICKMEMKEVTNTHLKKHNMKKNEYASLDSEYNLYLKKRMSNLCKKRKMVWNKGKTYTELIGKEEALKRNKKRIEKCKLINKDYMKEGKYKKIQSESKKNLYKNKPEVKQKISKSVNKWNKSHPEHFKRMSIDKREWLKNNPEVQKKMTYNSRHSPKQKKPVTEKIMEKILNEYNVYYIPQKNICGFFVDFYLPEYKIIIECDGNYWHNYPEGTDRDKRRDKILNREGFFVLRFWEIDLKNNLEKCKERLLIAISLEVDL